MKLLFEEQTYSKTSLKEILPDTYLNGYKVKCVGYYCSAKNGEYDPVFILPKIFQKGDFEKISDIIDTKKENATLRHFDQNLPWWIYRALNRYAEYKPESSNIGRDSINVKSSRHDKFSPTIIERILSLKDFYDNNKDLFLFIYKQSHSGFNRINWTKTVRKHIPLIKDKRVMYLDVVNNKKTINYNEELLVIFFNTLIFLNDEMGLPVIVDQPYELYGKEEFKRMACYGQVLGKLRRIRNNYFNDRLRTLWELLYAYYKSDSELRDGTKQEEYLIVKDFEYVFQRMVEYMIGDDSLNEFKKQDTEIDHLFSGKSVLGETGANEVCYIADSKYYVINKEDEENKLGKSSPDVKKQFGYARNFVQLAMDIKRDNHNFNSIADFNRDDVTEGYAIIPNFFIVPKVTNWDDRDDGFSKFGEIYEQNQFEGRIFDRDTLFLLKYKVNLKYLLYNYAKNNQAERFAFRRQVENEVISDMRQYIKNEYIVYKVSFKDEVELKDFVKSHFYDLAGRLFSNENRLIVALANDDKSKELTDLMVSEKISEIYM